MIYFDHTYTADPGHLFLKRLQQLGFTLDSREVEHPGRHFCRFIMFPQSGSPRGRTYLEFINVKRGGKPVKNPGLSFGYKSRLEKFHEKLERDGRYRSKYIHKNYEWKADNRSRLPGWNFVIFEALGLRGIFPWLTEYEPAPKRKQWKPGRPHPNGALSHRGFELEVNEKSEAFLSYLLGKKLKPRTKLSCGTELYISRTKRTKINSVVLTCKNVQRFLKKKDVEEIEFQGQTAALIRNPSGMWNIIITNE